MKLNIEQIIKAFECCTSEKYICEQCPIDEKIKDDCECGKVVARNALSLIKELTEDNEWSAKLIFEADKKIAKLTEENERLRAENDELCDNIACLEIDKENAERRTVRKMQTEIEARCRKGGIYPAFVKSTIDQIAKEMLEGEK